MSRAILTALALAGCVTLPGPPPCTTRRIDELYVDPGVSSADREPWLSADHLELWFRRDQNALNQLVFTTRSSVDQPFGSPTTSALSTGNEGAPFITDDGLELWFNRRSGSSGTPSVFKATRAMPSGDFADAMDVGLAGFDSVSLTHDGLTMIIASNGHLFTVSRTSTSAMFPTPLARDEIAPGVVSTGAEQHPSISADGASFAFERDDVDNVGTILSASGAGFVNLTSLETELGSGSASDGQPQLDRDGRTVAFSSNRDGAYQLFLYCE